MRTLLVFASLILLFVPVIYLDRTAKGHITPNPVSFFVRSVVAAMNLVTYFFTSGQDTFKTSVSLVSTVGLVTIFAYSLRKGRFSKVNNFDIVSGVIAILVAVIWKVSSDPVIANLLLQSAMFIAFVPAIRGVLAGVAREEVTPWALATLTYVLMVGALNLDVNTTWQQLVHPVFVGIGGNGGLMLAVIYKKYNEKGPLL